MVAQHYTPVTHLLLLKLVTSLAGLGKCPRTRGEASLRRKAQRNDINVYPGAHGELTFQEAIARSCNVYFYRMGERIGHLGLMRKPAD